MKTELVKLRLEKGLLQEEMAEKMGVTVGTYCILETGKAQGTVKNWNKIQKIFNIPDEKMWKLINSPVVEKYKINK